MGSEAIKTRPGTRSPASPALTSVAPAFDVCVYGLGYVGLPTAALLAASDRRVAGVDVRREVVEAVHRGEAPFAETHLDELIREAVAQGRLCAFAGAVRARTHILCVPTPITDTREADLGFVDAAVEALLRVVERGDLVVLESTVPPGTTRRRVGDRLRELGLEPGADVFVAHAPERVLPGDALRELAENPRILGGLTPACTERAAAFYRSFTRGPIHATTAEAAEVAKLAENAFRDVNIAFANELANVCAHLGQDVREVIRLANQHPRVDIHRPGPGVGGHCIPVDPWFLVQAAPHETPLLRTARAVNDARVARVVAEVRTAATQLPRPRIACFGLTYKPDADDLRNSPALAVVEMLVQEGFGELLLVEPHLSASPVAGHALVDGPTALREADVVVVLVAHRCFTELARGAFAERVVVDAAGLLDA